MKIPKSWAEVTIKQVINSSDISNDTEMNDIEKMAMMVSVMTNTPIIEVNKFTLTKTREIMAQMGFLNEQPSDKFVNEVVIQGKKYIVNPDITKITNEQFQAFEFFTRDKEAISSNLHNLMAIICLEEGQQYSMDTAPTRAELFYNHMTFDVVAPVSTFFFRLLTESSRNILHSLELKIDKSVMEAKTLIQELSTEV